jgi:hypothetical protein
VDTDVTGVGFGGVAASGPDDVDRLGEAETTGGSEEFASGPPARGENQGGRRGRVGGSKQVRGTTHDRSGDDTATGDAFAERDAARDTGIENASEDAAARDEDLDLAAGAGHEDEGDDFEDADSDDEDVR